MLNGKVLLWCVRWCLDTSRLCQLTCGDHLSNKCSHIYHSHSWHSLSSRRSCQPGTQCPTSCGSSTSISLTVISSPATFYIHVECDCGICCLTMDGLPCDTLCWLDMQTSINSVRDWELVEIYVSFIVVEREGRRKGRVKGKVGQIGRYGVWEGRFG